VIRLARALNAWGRPDFGEVLRDEIQHLDAVLLPLQQGLSKASYVSDANFRVMIIGVTEGEGFIQVKAGLFYAGIIAGCSCADDPTPLSEETEYCEVRLDIDRQTAETTVTLLPDPADASG
jgi:hypothetical protein